MNEQALKPEEHRLGRNYDRAAWFYEISAAIFSAGKIRASKKHAVRQLRPGERVLFLGVGSGEDAIMAAERGAVVTCIDLSRKMLEVLERKAERHNVAIDTICGNAFDHERWEQYDAVCSHYFLNIFLRDDMRRMLLHATKLVRPGGLFLIADVANAQGNPLARVFNILYLKLAMVSFWMLGLVPLHRNYDYREVFPEACLEIESVRHFRFLKWGPVLFQTIVARRRLTPTSLRTREGHCAPVAATSP